MLRPTISTLSRPRAGLLLCGFAVLALAVLGGCATPKPPEPRAIVELQATQATQPIPGKPVTGTIRFVQRGKEVVARGQIDSLRPGQSHAVYIYENGDCSGADAMNAGAHFNPDKRGHSYGGSGHAGDLPQVLANAQTAQADVNFVTTEFTLTPGPRSVVGKSVIVHRDADNPAAQPDGNAGPRLACGVIRLVPAAG